MIANLTFHQLISVLQTVFALQKNERALSIFVDLPNSSLPDNDQWQDRRLIAREWFQAIADSLTRTPFSTLHFISYENVGSNNNDLPAAVNVGIPERGTKSVHLDEILKDSSVVLAMTELSATAPLKMLARKHGFRGATLPGFTREMIPTLSLDYEKVNARVMAFKKRMDDAEGVEVRLSATGRTHGSYFDLRFRSGHASGGLIREPGTVANLPSGEAYIVPYEGERAGEPSRTKGILPVQFDQELVLYEIEANKAIRILSTGPHADAEKAKLVDEPAYGNIAEVGIGVLGEWGVTAVGSTLVDEKLGLHIAFGRSEHFGGITSPASFRNPKNVIHIDRVYVPSVQPMVNVDEVTFCYSGDKKETIIQSGKFIV